MSATAAFLRARDAMLGFAGNASALSQGVNWPRFDEFNWVADYFDVIARDNEALALRIIHDQSPDKDLSYSQLSYWATQIANLLETNGVKRGDRMLVMLGNVAPLWPIMLAAIRLGVVLVPTSTLVRGEDLADRINRGDVSIVATSYELVDRFTQFPLKLKIVVGQAAAGWLPIDEALSMPNTLSPRPSTLASDLLLLYFTSGTTKKPKLVAHTQESYPVGHLTTAHWLGLRKGETHLNLSSPGWGKHAWSSFFAPFNSEATVLAYHYERFDAKSLLGQLVRCEVTSLCAPPTVWKMLIKEPLKQWPVRLRLASSAGEPLSPEVIARVQDAWNVTIRDGFGQTETTALVGNPPGQPMKPGSMGRPLPGCPVVILDSDNALSDEGEICLDLAQRPAGLMLGYIDDAAATSEALRGGYYHTGDIAQRDADGYLTYVGRADDVFKSSGYRISPFELESVLIEHPAVVEAAVVPSPDAVRYTVPKAFISLAAGHEPSAGLAAEILAYVRSRVSPYKQVRRLEFASLPKTISGKIKRAELRRHEEAREAGAARGPTEFWDEDLRPAG